MPNLASPAINQRSRRGGTCIICSRFAKFGSKIADFVLEPPKCSTLPAKLSVTRTGWPYFCPSHLSLVGSQDRDRRLSEALDLQPVDGSGLETFPIGGRELLYRGRYGSVKVFA